MKVFNSLFKIYFSRHVKKEAGPVFKWLGCEKYWPLLVNLQVLLEISIQLLVGKQELFDIIWEKNTQGNSNSKVNFHEDAGV